MCVNDGIRDGHGADIRGREGQVGAARIDGQNAAGSRGVGNGKSVAVGAKVVGQRVNHDRREIHRRIGIIHRHRRKTIKEIIIGRDDAVRGNKGDLIVIRSLRIAGAVIAERIRLADDIMAGRDAEEGIIAGGIRGRAAHQWLAKVSLPVRVHVLEQLDRNVDDVGFADVVGAVTVGVTPHDTVDGGVDVRRRLIVEEVDIVGGRQCRQVDGPLITGRRGAVKSGQMIFHDDVVTDVEVQEFVIAAAVRGGDLHQSAVTRIAVAIRIGVKLERHAGEREIAGGEDAIGVHVIVNVTGDGACGRGHADGARRGRHWIAEKIRGEIHRGGIVGRIALADHFHRHVIGDDGVGRESQRIGEVRPDQATCPGTVVADGGRDELIICAAERVLERQIIDDGVADILDSDAENNVAADRDRSVGRTHQGFHNVQRRLIDEQGDGGSVGGGAAVDRGGIGQRAGEARGEEGDREVRALAGRESAKCVPGQNAGPDDIGREAGGRVSQFCRREIIGDDHVRQHRAAGVDDLQIIRHRLVDADLAAGRRENRLAQAHAGNAGRGLHGGRGAGVVGRIGRIRIARREDGTHRGIQRTVIGGAGHRCAGADGVGENARVDASLDEREHFRITGTAGDNDDDGVDRGGVGVAVQIGHANAHWTVGGVAVGANAIRAAGEFRRARRAEILERGGDARRRRGRDAFRAFARRDGDVVAARRRAGDPLIFVGLGRTVGGHHVRAGQDVGETGGRIRPGDNEAEAGDIVTAKRITDGGADINRVAGRWRADQIAARKRRVKNTEGGHLDHRGRRQDNHRRRVGAVIIHMKRRVRDVVGDDIADGCAGRNSDAVRQRSGPDEIGGAAGSSVDRIGQRQEIHPIGPQRGGDRRT